MPGQSAIGETHLHSSPPPFCFSLPSQEKKGSGTPTNAGHQPPHLAMRHAPYRARSSVGVPPRLSPKGIIPSQRFSFRPGFLGRGLNGRYPPSPVPVQGCTSRPGRNVGGLIPKPPGSELQIHPRAPHPLHLSACLRKASFGERISLHVIETVTCVNRKVTTSEASPARGRLAAQCAASGEVRACSAHPTRPPEPAIGPATSGRTRWAVDPPFGRGGCSLAGERNTIDFQGLSDHAYDHDHDDCRWGISRRLGICAESQCGAPMPPSMRPSGFLPVRLRR